MVQLSSSWILSRILRTTPPASTASSAASSFVSDSLATVASWPAAAPVVSDSEVASFFVNVSFSFSFSVTLFELPGRLGVIITVGLEWQDSLGREIWLVVDDFGSAWSDDGPALDGAEEPSGDDLGAESGSLTTTADSPLGPGVTTVGLESLV